MAPRARSPVSVGTCFVLLCGVLAGWMVGGVVPGELLAGAVRPHQQTYADNGRWQDEPFVIRDDRRLEIPWVFADFDLQMDLELAKSTTLDLVLRRVEPRTVGREFEQFHGRFTTLRLSAERAGEPWFTRERLLLGDRDAPGVELAPGYTATVWVKARGRLLEANVAGRRLPPFLADDMHGSILLAARGGTAVLKNIAITPRGFPSAWLWSRWTWLGIGVLAALLLRVAGLAGGFGPFASGAGLVAGVWIAIRGLARDVPPLWYPPPGALLAMLGFAVCLGLVFAGRRRFLGEWLAVGLALLWFAPPLGFDEAALDLVFGPDAGSALVEAHAQLVQVPDSLVGIHDVGGDRPRVFLLGGELVYGLEAKGRHLEVLLTGDLRVALQQKVDVPCLPTADGWSTQQWTMFERFYVGFRPGVIVFGVSAAEGDVDPATGERRSRPADLERTIAAALAWCADNSSRLVLFAGPGIEEDFLAVLRREEGRGTPLVVAGAADRPEQSRRLAAAVAPLLR